MKRITKINDNEYISKEVDHTTSLTGTIIELIIYLTPPYNSINTLKFTYSHAFLW